ncbi:MAG: polyphosphate kinase 1 [bacterium]|nr:polyphosphate kinase 1 [bacterium]
MSTSQPAQPLSSAPPPLDSSNYINRELSWLEFNRRVLAEAEDESLPLLDRLKFLAIVSSNFDEFFMVRVAAVHTKLQHAPHTSRPDGIPYSQLIYQIRQRTLVMMNRQRDLMTELLGRLREEGVYVGDVNGLPAAWQTALTTYFKEEVFPILTPLAVDHARPFPFISNLSLNLAVSLRRVGKPDDDPEFVRLKVPDMLPRLVRLEHVLLKYSQEEYDRVQASETFVWLESLIAANLDQLFPGMEVIAQSPFRLTRNADIDFEHELEDDDNEMIDDYIEKSLRERQFGQVVRLSVPNDIDHTLFETLLNRLEIDRERDVYRISGALGGSSLMQLLSVDRPDLKQPPYQARIMEGFRDEENIFATIRRHDVLVHHPYDSFHPVERFFHDAAHDPDVLAIKVTLYRVGRNSPIVRSLMQARENDKQVAVLVELKARFDEENNLEWARALDEKGVHVTYGVEELAVKTHAKIALVVRKEPDGVHRYVHLGTGNYNSSTARLYTDLGVFTCNREIADDATRLFNRLTGYAPGTTYERLLVAPEILHSGLIRLIDNEIAAAHEGKPARLIFKMNQLEEDEIIRKLYQASQAGVQIDLIVRGICCLRPGLAGMSENIRVRSIVGRYLEHSRIYYFQNAPEDKRLYLGSADLMRRNLYNRVEVVFPVLDVRLQHSLLRILATQLQDNVNAWVQHPDDSYTPVIPAPGERLIDSQAIFMEDSAGLRDLPPGL